MSMANYNMTVPEYKEFKELYEEAVKKKKDQFLFKELPILVSFAKYFIEYYDGKILKKV